MLHYYSFPPLTGQCPTLVNPSNGSVVVNSTHVGGVAFYSCSTGYTLIGLTTRVCLASETWSGDEPGCISSKHATKYISLGEGWLFCNRVYLTVPKDDKAT